MKGQTRYTRGSARFAAAVASAGISGRNDEIIRAKPFDTSVSRFAYDSRENAVERRSRSRGTNGVPVIAAKHLIAINKYGARGDITPSSMVRG